MANFKYFLIQALLFFCSSSQSLEFIYNGFNSSNLDLFGATEVTQEGALKLTNRDLNVIGQAFCPTSISMFNNNSRNASSFSTHFVLQIVPSSSKRGGFGLAFVLSPTPSLPHGEPGHYLGVFNSANDGNATNHIFMVEFDTVKGHNKASDRESSHIGININGIGPDYAKIYKPASYSVGTQGHEEDLPFADGQRIQAWIDYNGVNKTVSVTVAPLNNTKPDKPLLDPHPLDLSLDLVENMYVGFSAATGDNKSSSHYILGWSFKLNGIASQLNTSQLPEVPDEKSSSSNDKLRKALIATLSVVLFILLGVLVILILYKRVREFQVLEEWELDSPHRFKYRDLHKATKGFQESEKIGAGGFGTVYKGVLPSNGVEIAVKKIMSKNHLQGMREFAAEIESLGRLRHKNLVNLQGWCKHKSDLLLIYDFVPNGSLDSLLYRNTARKGVLLTWEQRFNIIKGVASGLLYLHEEWEQVVIHRDVKSSNVLIDRGMNAKLGDFGLARLYNHGKIAHTTSVVGTIGYIAPELIRTGKASTWTDVFAFGILLLEVACGKTPVAYEANRNLILVDYVVECVEKGNIFDAIDAKLEKSYVVEEVELVLGLGLLCSHPKPEERPNMRQVMKYLNGDELLPILDQLSSSCSRRIDEIGSRFLALGLTNGSSNSYQTFSVGAATSSGSFEGR